MTYVPANISQTNRVNVHTFSAHSLGPWYIGHRTTATASGTYDLADRIHYYPFAVWRPFSLARWFWYNGATVGTNYIQAAIYDANLNLFKASPRTLSAGTANEVQYANPGIHGTSVTSGADTTDGTVWTTASVTLKAGVLYLMAVGNSKASAADAVSSIDSATGGYPTFTSRSTTTYDTSTAKRVSIWSAVPTSDFTGTLRINFSATQTGAIWALNAFYHVDTATTDGVVQNAVGTGSVSPALATLSAFGSAQNAAMAAFGNAGASNGAPTGATTLELSDSVIATPAHGMQTSWATNDTTMDYTITSSQWGACAVEIKSLGTGAVYVPPMRGYMAIHCNGTTATLFRTPTAEVGRTQQYEETAAKGAPPTATLSPGTGNIYVFGFTSRSSP